MINLIPQEKIDIYKHLFNININYKESQFNYDKIYLFFKNTCESFFDK